MSIYATQWRVMFPRYGDSHIGCEWIEVLGQGVPAHIGTPTEGFGYESGDPYADFLPPPVIVSADDDEGSLRALVIVTKDTVKRGQEYVSPLLVLTGSEYAMVSFAELHSRICDALRGDRPRLLAEVLTEPNTVRLLYEDGSSRIARL